MNQWLFGPPAPSLYMLFNVVWRFFQFCSLDAAQEFNSSFDLLLQGRPPPATRISVLTFFAGRNPAEIIFVFICDIKNGLELCKWINSFIHFIQKLKKSISVYNEAENNIGICLLSSRNIWVWNGDHYKINASSVLSKYVFLSRNGFTTPMQLGLKF